MHEALTAGDEGGEVPGSPGAEQRGEGHLALGPRCRTDVDSGMGMCFARSG